ncbi:GC-rich sequence DNA-binding factor 2, partial [Saguinus oedipus]
MIELRDTVDFAESRTVDVSTDEEDEIHHSSESKDDQGLSSDSSSSLGEKELSSADQSIKIPDAAFIQAARRKRELARVQDDYISLDVEHASTISGMKIESEDDPESEPDDHEKRIPFTLKPQTLRQRMVEESKNRYEETSESQEDEKQDIWVQQQMRKAVKITEIWALLLECKLYKCTLEFAISERDVDLLHSCGSSKVKKFDTSISFPPVNLEIIKKQLNTRLTLLQETHRSHLREYEKYVQDVKSSKSTIQNLESSSNQALNCKFYKSMKIYVENLIDCLNEKIINIQEIESSMHSLLLKQAMTFMKRRQDELKHESTYLQQLSHKDETSTNGNFTVDEKTQWILEEIESRRTKRKQARVLSGNYNHQEGTSSDDELSSAEMKDFQKSQGQILAQLIAVLHGRVFKEANKVHNLKCIKRLILLTGDILQDQKKVFEDLDSTGLKEMPWFKSVEEFMDSSIEDSTKESSSDKKILSTIINKTVVPRLTAKTNFVEFLWDPLSTSQTTSLITHCKVILEEHSTCENEVSKSKQ